MKKRAVFFGTYDTVNDGKWTLTGLVFTDPVYDQNFVKIPGSSVTLDMSTALSDGEPTYSQRTLTALFESSEGDRLARKTRIDAMVNRLDGRRLDIVLPDDPDHYITGRLSVQVLYNDMAHASVQVTAICDPWRYNNIETVVNLLATTEAQNVILVNNGRNVVVPAIEVTGEVVLKYNSSTLTLTEGTYKTPVLYMTTGDHELTYSTPSTGSLTLTYREASL